MSRILVCAKVNPDLDGTACTLAYSHLLNKEGVENNGIVFGEPQSEVIYFEKVHGIKIPRHKNNEGTEWKKFILVDASSMIGIPKPVTAEKVIEIIDHRVGEPEKEFSNAKIQNDLIGAAATIIVERFVASRSKPTPDHAKLLYGAIFHNTLNLTSSNTNNRDKKAILYLGKEFGLKRSMVEEMFKYSSKLIISDFKNAIIADAKEIGYGFQNKIGAHQLILWMFDNSEYKLEIETASNNIFKNTNNIWNFINIIDLKGKKSILYCPDIKGQEILESTFEINMEKGWGVLNCVLLRKQIMPLIAKQA